MDWQLPPIYLASGSPRRRELLEQIGIEYTRVPAEVDEAVLDGESPESYVQRLAEAKASAGANSAQAQAEPRPVLGADTTVVIDDQILGKPACAADAERVLSLLSGRTHLVHTGIAICLGGRCQTRVVTTEVTFREITSEEIAAYWQSGEPADKAGSYGIQGLGGRFVSRINGSYPAVVGLPLAETEQLLRAIVSQSAARPEA